MTLPQIVKMSWLGILLLQNVNTNSFHSFILDANRRCVVKRNATGLQHGRNVDHTTKLKQLGGVGNKVLMSPSRGIYQSALRVPIPDVYTYK